jgi:hypothetical protein
MAVLKTIKFSSTSKNRIISSRILVEIDLSAFKHHKDNSRACVILVAAADLIVAHVVRYHCIGPKES